MAPPPSLSQLIDIMDRFQKTHWQLPTIHQKLKHRGAQHKGERVCINEADTLPEWWRCSGNTPSSSPWSGPGTTRRHRRHNKVRLNGGDNSSCRRPQKKRRDIKNINMWRKKRKKKISYLFFVFLSSLKCSALHVARGRKQQQQLIFFFFFPI